MPGRIFCFALVCCLLASACTRQSEAVPVADDLPDCHVIFDAGSKGTRLYIYQRSGSGWLKHGGPRTVALADPVRRIRGKSMDDAGLVVEKIVTTLTDIRSDGPENKKGEPKWPAYDWQKNCNVQAVSVYATAGMRLAEQLDPDGSEVLWNLLNQRLSAAVNTEVTTRTLSGFEEGLYAWLAMRERQGDEDFGVAEMGGASVQVAFPCPRCETGRRVRVGGRQVAIYSYSLTGWGQDEAWKRYGSSDACARGAGLNDPNWEAADCSVGMRDFERAAAHPAGSIEEADVRRWYLSDAFRYMNDDDIERFCGRGIDSGYEPVSSCFRAVYLSRVLDALGLPDDAETTDVDWTLGAVVCEATQCLEVQ